MPIREDQIRHHGPSLNTSHGGHGRLLESRSSQSATLTTRFLFRLISRKRNSGCREACEPAGSETTASLERLTTSYPSHTICVRKGWDSRLFWCAIPVVLPLLGCWDGVVFTHPLGWYSGGIRSVFAGIRFRGAFGRSVGVQTRKASICQNNHERL